MGEEWRKIPGFKGYEVSNRGRVRSYHLRGARRDKCGPHPHLLSPSTKGIGYECVQLRRNGKSHVRTIHSLVALVFLGPRPSGKQCCHNDGNPSNNCIENIRYDTPGGNAIDRARHGNSPLSPKQIRRIRWEYQNRPETFEEIGRRWHCRPGVIGDIIHGRTYAGLGGPIFGEGELPTPKKTYKLNLSRAKSIYMERQSKGTPYKRLGDKYGISESMAYRICVGDRWPEVADAAQEEE